MYVYSVPEDVPTFEELQNARWRRYFCIFLWALLALTILADCSSAQTITVQPQAVSVPAGQAATFSVSFTGGVCHSVWYATNGVGNAYGPTSGSPMVYAIPNTITAWSGSQVQVILYSCSQASSYVLSNPATLIVTPSVPLLSIMVSPLSPTIAVGSMQQFTVKGTYSDSTTGDLTDSSTWTSSAPAVATVNTIGIVSALTPGTATITATFQGLSSSATVSVDPAKIILTVNSNSTLVFDDGSVVYNGTLIPEQWNPSTSAWVQAGSVMSQAGVLSGTLVIDPNLADPTGNIQFQFSLPGIANMGLPTVPLIRFQQGSSGITVNETLFKQPFMTKLLAVEKVSGIALTP